MSKGKQDLDVNSTVQMSSEELARLHAELEGRQREAEPDDADAVEFEAEEELEAPMKAAPKPAPQAAPKVAQKPVAKPAAAPAQKAPQVSAPKKANPERYLAPAVATGGTGLLIVGGIGALLAGLKPGLEVIPMFQGMGDMIAMLFVGAGLGAVGHLMLGLGMFAAVSRTGGIAALVGTLHMVAVLGLVFFLLAALEVIPVEGELAKLVLVAPSALPGTAWLLSGIWALSAVRALGPMGIVHGIFAMLGGAAQVGLVVAMLADAFGSQGYQHDLAIALIFTGIGGVLLGAIFLSVPMFGRLRRAG